MNPIRSFETPSPDPLSDVLSLVKPRSYGSGGLTAGGRWAYELLRARGNSIEGGTTEVLKNIVAERVLGLPKAR